MALAPRLAARLGHEVLRRGHLLCGEERPHVRRDYRATPCELLGEHAWGATQKLGGP